MGKWISKKKLGICLISLIAVIAIGFAAKKYITSNVDTSVNNSNYTSKSSETQQKMEPKEESKNSNEITNSSSKDTSSVNLSNNIVASNDSNAAKAADVTPKAAEGADNNINQQKTDGKSNYNYKEFFKNDVFLGDSISEELSFYEFLNDENVAAKKGVNIYKAKDEIDKVVQKNPKRIFILFGVNDMDGTLTSQQFVGYYEQIIQNVKDKIPNCQIYVQSIFPVLPEVAKSRPYLSDEHVNEFNTALINMAKKDNIHYINVAAVLNENNRNLYEPDGIHFKSDFCSLWLNYIVENINK